MIDPELPFSSLACTFPNAFILGNFFFAVGLTYFILVSERRYRRDEMHKRWRTVLCKFIKFKVRNTDPARE